MGEERSSCCTSCMKCFLLFLAVVLAFLCVAGAVVFGVLYYRFAVQQGIQVLEGRLSELQSQLNQSQSLMNTLQAQVLQIPSQFEAQVQVFQDQFGQFMDDANSNRNEQIAAVKADFNESFINSGINDAIIAANNEKAYFISRVVNSSSAQLADLNDNVNASINVFRNAVSVDADKARTDWSDTINTVNARISASGEHKTFVRYGSSTCPDTEGTTLIYSGYNSGTPWNAQGGASNFLCLPSDPEYTLPDANADSVIYGSEYESVFFGSSNENIPCAVCSISNRPEVIMIPAKVNCPASWTREYFGYLMSENRSNQRSSFICVDEGMEFIDGKTGNQIGSDLWIVEASCVSLPCGPYNEEAEMSCVVCSK